MGWKIIEPGIDSFRNPYEQLASKEHETILASNLPNYFAPENFHLVRAAVGDLSDIDKETLFKKLIFEQQLFYSTPAHIAECFFLSPVEHVITAYLKVKEAN